MLSSADPTARERALTSLAGRGSAASALLRVAGPAPPRPSKCTGAWGRRGLNSPGPQPSLVRRRAAFAPPRGHPPGPLSPPGQLRSARSSPASARHGTAWPPVKGLTRKGGGGQCLLWGRLVAPPLRSLLPAGVVWNFASGRLPFSGPREELGRLLGSQSGPQSGAPGPDSHPFPLVVDRCQPALFVAPAWPASLAVEDAAGSVLLLRPAAESNHRGLPGVAAGGRFPPAQPLAFHLCPDTLWLRLVRLTGAFIGWLP